MPAHDCGTCTPEIQRGRGCSLRGVPGPAVSRCVSTFCGREQEWRNCRTALATPEHVGLFGLWRRWRAGWTIWPSILDAPGRMIRQLEAIDSEVRAIQAQQEQADHG